MTISTRRHLLVGFAILAVGAALGIGTAALAQQTAPAEGKKFTQPVYRVPRQPRVAATNSEQAPSTVKQVAGQEHPLVPAVRLARSSLQNIDANINDYTATLIKRERVDGTLGDYQYIYLKVRHKPFSVYMYFRAPQKVRGRECLYVEGQNNQNLIAHEGTGLITKTVRIDPTGWLAMRGQKYAITKIGLRNLTDELVKVADSDMRIGGECEVKWYKDTKIGKGEDARTCTCLHVTHPVKRPGYRFNTALIFIDDELQVPIRYQAFLWPKRPGGQPELEEEYTYMNLKVNPGLTDRDFDENNPQYDFH